IYNEDNIKTLYILDVHPMSKNNLESAVNLAHQKESKNIDVILYIGLLSFKPRNLLKVPKLYEPKNIYMSGKILDCQVRPDIFNIANWNVNLSNYDVR
ncbi:hypothetical protein N9B14_03520, partial [Akkermansiaceae bacterium]|nr:hypothetical protein [Akkermansiaceae bacterium]